MRARALPSPPRRHRGFTLIEIIVVLLVFSVMAAMAYGGLNSVLRTRQGIEQSMQRTAELQRAYQRLRGDFQNLRDRPARDAFGDAQAPLSIDREGRLNLIRGGWRSPLQAGRSSLERVAYRFEDGTLLRAAWRAVDLPQEATPRELPLLRKVEEVRWRFLDAGYEWQTQWPFDPQQGSLSGSTAASPPPLAVEVRIVTRDWGELRFLFRTPQAGLVQGGGSGDAQESAATSQLLTREGLLPANALGTRASAPSPQAKPEAEAPLEASPPPDAVPEDPGIPSGNESTENPE